MKTLKIISSVFAFLILASSASMAAELKMKSTHSCSPGPNGITFEPWAQYFDIELIGAGGPGGGANSGSASYISVGDGGGSGSLVIRKALPVPPSRTAVVVVAGVTAGTSGHGADGATTTYSDSNGTISAPGGSGGTTVETNEAKTSQNGWGGRTYLPNLGGSNWGGMSIGFYLGRWAQGGAGAGIAGWAMGYPAEKLWRTAEGYNGRAPEGCGGGGSGAVSWDAGARNGGNGGPGGYRIVQYGIQN